MSHFGQSVSGAGDVNNDGFDDFIIGAYMGGPYGRVYVYSGQSGSVLYTFNGEVIGDYFGRSVSSAGDVDNDGFDDIVVGASGRAFGGYGPGQVYVYSGQSGDLLYSQRGETETDLFGFSVSGAGDVNGDGFDDLIVGAQHNGSYRTGKAYVYSGQNQALLFTFTGETYYDYFGASVSGAGDVNNDGYDDLIVAAEGNDAGGEYAGRAYVYSGHSGTLLYTFTGKTVGGVFGGSVSCAGDVNGDGFDDLVVGEKGNDAGGDYAGRAYVYSGQYGILLYTFTGRTDFDLLGISVSGAGDVNNDGFDDLIIGAAGSAPGGNDAGQAFVFIDGFVCGDINASSGEADVADLTYLVDYLFGGGPPPSRLEAADLDGSGNVNVADLTYLVDYLFGGGPEPVCS